MTMIPSTATADTAPIWRNLTSAGVHRHTDHMIDRRGFLTLSAAAGLAVACSPRSESAGAADAVDVTLEPTATEIDLGGVTVGTWAYGREVPGREIRVRKGETLRAQVTNQLPVDTTIHWHGVALRNDMDGVPVLTQAPIPSGERFTYEFAVPDAGTYMYHSHVGTQLDRGLYGPLIIEDPDERTDYDHELIIMLDDWVDGPPRPSRQWPSRRATRKHQGGVRHRRGWRVSSPQSQHRQEHGVDEQTHGHAHVLVALLPRRRRTSSSPARQFLRAHLPHEVRQNSSSVVFTVTEGFAHQPGDVFGVAQHGAVAKRLTLTLPTQMTLAMQILHRRQHRGVHDLTVGT